MRPRISRFVSTVRANERALKLIQAVFRFPSLESSPVPVRSIGHRSTVRRGRGLLPGSSGCAAERMTNFSMEGICLNNVLSVILPVHDAQLSLEAGVTEMLEVLPELSDRLELCIVDDGSTDETAEVAYELAARYPQLDMIRHPVRLGLAEAIQTGLDHTHGEIIFIGDEGYSLDPDDLRTLWQLRDVGHRMTSGENSARSFQCEAWMKKLATWKTRSSRSGEQRGFQMIRRRAFEQFRLQQAMEMITRIDRAAAQQTSPSGRQPNYLLKPKRLAGGQ